MGFELTTLRSRVPCFSNWASHTTLAFFVFMLLGIHWAFWIYGLLFLKWNLENILPIGSKDFFFFLLFFLFWISNYVYVGLIVFHRLLWLWLLFSPQSFFLSGPAAGDSDWLVLKFTWSFLLLCLICYRSFQWIFYFLISGFAFGSFLKYLNFSKLCLLISTSELLLVFLLSDFLKYGSYFLFFFFL